MNKSIHTWPAKPWILTVFLALTGLLYHSITDGISVHSNDVDQVRIALAVFICIGALTFAFSLEKKRWLWAIVFSVSWGAIMAGVSYWSINSNAGRFLLDFSWWAGLLSVAIALPIFQTRRDQTQNKLPYKQLHAYAWNDLVCWCTALLFVGISFALAHLLAALFNLIGLDFLKELLKKDWFILMFIGATFGGSLGVLKQNERIVLSMQNLVMTVLSILTPVLGIGLIIFLCSLIFTSLQPLWDATKNTTPILLSCAIGAIILANAVIRDDIAQESTSKILRYNALGLSLCILPLSIIAAVSLQLRVAQYGLTPDRIWGLISVAVFVICGLAYSVLVLKTRHHWMASIRSTNIWLAVGLCIIAVFLAMPIMDFGAMSVKNQLARLDDGRVKPKDFDFVAFAFDFGPKGREVLDEMLVSDNNILASGAKTALQADYRWTGQNNIERAKESAYVENQLKVFPQQLEIPAELSSAISEQGVCIGNRCLLVWEKPSSNAQLIYSNCDTAYGSAQLKPAECVPTIISFKLDSDQWQPQYPNGQAQNILSLNAKEKIAFWSALERGEIELRKVEHRQIFVGDQAIGESFK